MGLAIRTGLFALISSVLFQVHAILPTGVTIEPFYDVTKPGLSFEEDKHSILAMEEVPGLPQHFLVLGQFGYVWALYPDTTKNFDPHGENEYTKTQLADFNEMIMKGWEQGAISGAFDPYFKQNRYFYINYMKYTDPSLYHGGVKPNKNDGPRNNGIVVIERWKLSEDHMKLTKDATILEVEHGKGYGTHYMTFGKDNYLYLSLDSYSKNSWDLNDLQRKILRIDVSKQEKGKLYAIPPDNPFVNNPDARDEIWTYGHRNLWCLFSNYLTGTMWGGEIGQGLWEELNLLNKPGGNYGWANGGDGSGGGVGIEGPCSENTESGQAYVYKSGMASPYSYQGDRSNGKKYTCANMVNGTWNFHHGGKDYGGSETALPGLKMNSIAVGPAFRGDPSSPFYGYHFISDIRRNYFVAAIEGKKELQNVGGIKDNMVVELKGGNTREISFTGDRGHNGIITFSEDSYGYHYVILGASSSRGAFDWHDIYRIKHPEMKPLAKPRYQVHPIEGCMDPKAENYDITASVDSKNCKYNSSSGQPHVHVSGIAISDKKVTVGSSGPHSVELFNVKGDLVFSRRGQDSRQYSLSGVGKGIYLVKVVTPELIKTKRLLFYK